jgi:glycosyltransferase involved in cell wall biosynthesis
MNILILSHKPPYPIVDGSCHAMDRFLRDLLKSMPKSNIDYISVATQKHVFNTEKIPEDLAEVVNFDAVNISTKIDPFNALIQLIKNKSYHISRFKNEKIIEKIKSVIHQKKIDFIFFESIFCGIYAKEIKELSSATQVLRAHNVEHLIWRKLALNSKNPLKKWYLNHLSKTLQDFEEEFVAKMDHVFSIAPSDQLFFKTRNNQSNYIPVSMEVSSVRKLKAKKISFLGAYNWMPNKEAILWFTNEVWPEIAKLNPTTEFHIAGSYSEEIAELKNIEGIELHGFVNSSQEFMKEHGIFIAPILSGSGVKMKVLEAMSHGVPCVLSTHAAEGLNLPEIIPICKNKEAFIEKVSLLLQNEQLSHEIGIAGREHILEKYNSQSVSNKIKRLLLN